MLMESSSSARRLTSSERPREPPTYAAAFEIAQVARERGGVPLFAGDRHGYHVIPGLDALQNGLALPLHHLLFQRLAGGGRLRQIGKLNLL